jgi:hypothetical protein
MERCRFGIDEKEIFVLFSKHKGFQLFVTAFMAERQHATRAEDTFHRIYINGSCGQHIANKEQSLKVITGDAQNAF